MVTFSLNLGSSKTGLSLGATFLNSAASGLSSTGSGFLELTNGQYLFNTSLPNGTVAVSFYEMGEELDPYFTVAVGPQATVPAPLAGDSVLGYLYTRNASGLITGGLTVNYQTVGVDSSYSDSWDDGINTVTSDNTGLATLTLPSGTHTRYWVGSGRYKTVHITDTSVDPVSLADVLG